jgi:hypothetical protein
MLLLLGTTWSRRLVLIGALVGTALVTPSYKAPSVPSFARLPRLVIWAWERPEDLGTLGSDIGVAFLAQTITASGAEIAVEPRRQPLRVGDSTVLVAVTRIESAALAWWPLTSKDASDVAFLIARTAKTPRVAGRC